MDKANFITLLTEEVNKYITNEGAYDADTTYIEVAPATLTPRLVEIETDLPEDADGPDYYAVLDFLAATTEGLWIADATSIALAADDYFPE